MTASFRPIRLVGPLVMVVLLIAGVLYVRSMIGPDRPAETVAVRGGQLVGSIRTEPRTFNRLMAQDQVTDLLNTLMQGRLVRTNRSTFELEPWLAEKWESSADGREHVFNLRPGVTWSDGTPVTADDVVFSLQAASSEGSVLASSLT